MREGVEKPGSLVYGLEGWGWGLYTGPCLFGAWHSELLDPDARVNLDDIVGDQGNE